MGALGTQYKATAMGIEKLLYFVFAPWTLPAWHIEAEVKWLPLCKWYFETNFLEWKLLNFYSNRPDFAPKDSINK